MKKPNFFILGGMKCGTTSMYQWLKSNSEIFMSNPKEPKFFCDDLNTGSIDDMDEYLDLFSDASTRHKAVGEASVTYLFSKTAVENIEEYFSSPKYLVLVRNPIEMARSLHAHEVYTLGETVTDFSQAWEMSSKRRNCKLVKGYCKVPSFHLDYKRACKLGSQIQRVLGHISRENLKIIFLDDLKNNPKKVYLETLSFLGVSNTNLPVFDKKNTAKTYKSRLIAHCLKSTAYAYRQLLSSIGLEHVSTGILSFFDKINTRDFSKSSISSDLWYRMCEYYEDEIALLEDLAGRDLSHWLENPSD